MQTLSKSELKESVGYNGFSTKSPLGNGDDGIFVDETGITIVSCCINCGHYNRIKLTEMELEHFLHSVQYKRFMNHDPLGEPGSEGYEW